MVGATPPGVGAGVGIGVCRSDGAGADTAAVEGIEMELDRGVPTFIGVCPRCGGCEDCCTCEDDTKPGRGVVVLIGVPADGTAEEAVAATGVAGTVPMPGPILGS